MNRITWIDSYKGCLMLLVMLGHSLQYVLQKECFDSTLWNVIYSFHMPCFFAASGFFARDRVRRMKEVGSIILRRFRQLLIPMTLWQILLDLIPPPHQEISLLKYMDCGSFWFLWALFFISALWSIGCGLSQLLKINYVFVQLFVTAVLLIVLVVFGYREHGFHYIAYYYPYYVLGHFLYRSSYVRVLKTGCLWGLLGLWFILALFWEMHTCPFYLEWLCFLPESMLVTMNRYMVGTIAIIAMTGLAQHYLTADNKETRVLISWGTTSLALYTIHVSMFEIGQKIGVQFFGIQKLDIVLVFLVFLIVSSITALLLKKNKWTSLLLLGKIN